MHKGSVADGWNKILTRNKIDPFCSKIYGLLTLNYWEIIRECSGSLSLFEKKPGTQHVNPPAPTFRFVDDTYIV